MQVSETDVNKSSLLKVGRDTHKEAGGFVVQMKKNRALNPWINENVYDAYSTHVQYIPILQTRKIVEITGEKQRNTV